MSDVCERVCVFDGEDDIGQYTLYVVLSEYIHINSNIASHFVDDPFSYNTLLNRKQNVKNCIIT